MRHGPPQVRRHHRVGVDHEHAFDGGIRQRTIEGDPQRVPFASQLVVSALKDLGSRLQRAVRGVIAAVVGDDEDAPLADGVVRGHQAGHRGGDARGFVVRGDHRDQQQLSRCRRTLEADAW